MYMYIYIYSYIYIYMIYPSPRMALWQMKVYFRIPDPKNVIILVVTGTGWGVDPVCIFTAYIMI